jgi:hypothetical protein
MTKKPIIEHDHQTDRYTITLAPGCYLWFVVNPGGPVWSLNEPQVGLGLGRGFREWFARQRPRIIRRRHIIAVFLRGSQNLKPLLASLARGNQR